MPRLYLLRHAKAAWGTPGTSDFDRPLTPDGMIAARAAGAALESEGVTPALVLCSPALRTRQTLECLSEPFTGELAVRMDATLYDSDADAYMRALRSAGDAPSVLMVGHNPTTEDFGSMLVSGGEPHALAALEGGFPVCAMAIIDFAMPFAQVSDGDGQIAGFVVHEG